MLTRLGGPALGGALLLAASWLAALAGALLLSLTLRPAQRTLTRWAAICAATATLLLGVSLLLSVAPGWETWLAALQPPVSGAAGASLLLLLSVLHQRVAPTRAGAWFDAALGWLAVAAGAWALWGLFGG